MQILHRIFWLVVVTQIAGIPAEPSAAEEPLEYISFYVSRFGAIIAYPPSIFVRYEDPANGDGRTFFTPDCRARFSVYGGFNIDRQSLEAYARQARTRYRESGAEISYDRVTDRFFALSGTAPGERGEDEIFYEKGMLSEGGAIAIGFNIVYPARERSTFDPVVARMSASARLGRPRARDLYRHPQQGPLPRFALGLCRGSAGAHAQVRSRPLSLGSAAFDGLSG